MEGYTSYRQKDIRKTDNMKKVILPTLVFTIMVAAMLKSCDVHDGDHGYPGEPQLTDLVTSDCHTFTDTLSTKDMNTDSVVV